MVRNTKFDLFKKSSNEKAEPFIEEGRKLGSFPRNFTIIRQECLPSRQDSCQRLKIIEMFYICFNMGYQILEIHKLMSSICAHPSSSLNLTSERRLNMNKLVAYFCSMRLNH